MPRLEPVYPSEFGPLFNETGSTALIKGNTYHCNSWDYGPTSIITCYRGLEYYRALPEMSQYTHTVPPNYFGYDCGDDSSFTMAHIAARSYHDGGVNVCFTDGSVHFIANGIAFPASAGPRHPRWPLGTSPASFDQPAFPRPEASAMVQPLAGAHASRF